MDNGFAIKNFSVFPIKNFEDIIKYSSMGFFSYDYLLSLDPLNSAENLVKDHGIKRFKFVKKEGDYLNVYIADFKHLNRMSFSFSYDKNRFNITVGDLLDLLDWLFTKYYKDRSDMFVKFDTYAEFTLR